MKRRDTVKSSLLTHFLSGLPPYLAEREPNVGELLLEGLVHVLLEVRRFDVFDDRRLERKTRGGVRGTRPRTLVLDSTVSQ